MRSGLPALGGGESSGQIRMSTHLYSKRKVCNLIFLGYKLIIRGVFNYEQILTSFFRHALILILERSLETRALTIILRFNVAK